MRRALGSPLAITQHVEEYKVGCDMKKHFWCTFTFQPEKCALQYLCTIQNKTAKTITLVPFLFNSWIKVSSLPFFQGKSGGEWFTSPHPCDEKNHYTHGGFLFRIKYHRNTHKRIRDQQKSKALSRSSLQPIKTWMPQLLQIAPKSFIRYGHQISMFFCVDIGKWQLTNLKYILQTPNRRRKQKRVNLASIRKCAHINCIGNRTLALRWPTGLPNSEKTCCTNIRSSSDL